MWVGNGGYFQHAVFAAFGVSALAASLLPNLYDGDQVGPKVGIVGDSVTCLSAKDLQSDFGGKYAFQIACHNGITITQGTPDAVRIVQSAQGQPAAMIINLGTNDGLQAEHDLGPHNAVDVATAEQSLNVLAWDIQHVPCVIWVTVSEIPDVYHSSVTHAINAWIHSRSETVPGNYALDWWGLLNHGENGRLWLSPWDGVHTTTPGQAELASLYLQAVQSDCSASAPSSASTSGGVPGS